MIVCKFGGTCITVRNLSKVKTIVESDKNRRFVVVSAVGKSFADDEKVTDLLMKYHQSGFDKKYFDRVSDKYRQLVLQNGINFDVDEAVQNAQGRIFLHNSLPYTLSVGEELAAKIVAQYLDFPYVEAERIICFTCGVLDKKETHHRIKSLAKSREFGVVGGFYGGQLNTRQTFTRGGSDVTASLFAAATKSMLCENWTDTDGCKIASPKKVFKPKTISCMCYDDLKIMCDMGAEVLHKDAVLPLKKANVPLFIGSVYKPLGESTLITNVSEAKSVLSVTTKKEGGAYVSKIVYTLEQKEIITRLAECCKKESVILTKALSMPNCLTLHTSQDCTEVFYRFFCID